MKIDHEFTVGASVDEAWRVLTDLEGIAPCMPGARLTGVEGDVYSGRVKVKVGPVISEYAGTARFVEKDDAAHRAVIDAKGKDSRGAGNASAKIQAGLRPDASDAARTVVTVSTDLSISGKIAQFGSGMIKDVSTKLLGQFVENLEAKLQAESQAAPVIQEPPETKPQPIIRAVPAPSPAPPSPNDDEALDLLSLAGASVRRRAIAAGAGAAALAALIVYFVIK
ncbi:SRPBCC family protein [Kineosporia babensis]|uniref:SRPBCC family protein n=1 Tax=Kineosporia babensis TaxID=499548 RepID=A0A9X1SYF0_9ACTN|nr:SRPBCC family protein [Kineosporia babensis]MCD5316285.1 SRPBCC family protein [Kineosporia babensis]